MVIFRILLVIAGLTLISVTLFATIDSQKYSEWQSTTADLEYSYIRTIGTYRSPAVYYIAFLSYEYEVDGTSYKSQRLQPFQYIYTPKENILSLAGLDSVDIFFDPDNPEDSFVYISYPWTQLILIFLAGISLIYVAMTISKLKEWILGIDGFGGGGLGGT